MGGTTKSEPLMHTCNAEKDKSTTGMSAPLNMKWDICDAENKHQVQSFWRKSIPPILSGKRAHKQFCGNIVAGDSSIEADHLSKSLFSIQHRPEDKNRVSYESNAHAPTSAQTSRHTHWHFGPEATIISPRTRRLTCWHLGPEEEAPTLALHRA